MNILLVSATGLEIEPTLSHFNVSQNVTHINEHRLSVLITGVGMTAAGFALGQNLCSQDYNLAVNAGIAGAFDRSLKLGEVVTVGLDCFAEMGAEDGDDFISIDELELGKSSIRPRHPFENLTTSLYKKVKGISVNKVHGNDESIYNTVERLNPQTESMEGAAFFYACNQTDTPCLQLRAISNYIERRNRESWNISLAVKNLNDSLITLLSTLP
jgi:futalosine hydrolase